MLKDCYIMQGADKVLRTDIQHKFKYQNRLRTVKNCLIFYILSEHLQLFIIFSKLTAKPAVIVELYRPGKTKSSC